MSNPSDTIRVVIPLAIRRRNGRPRILPPEDTAARQARAQDPHILKALGRAWAWRRRIDSGEMATAGEIARAEGVTERYVSRTMRLAYLSPDVTARILFARQPPVISWNELVSSSRLSWDRQPNVILAAEALQMQVPAEKELPRSGK